MCNLSVLWIVLYGYMSYQALRTVPTTELLSYDFGCKDQWEDDIKMLFSTVKVPQM